MSTRAIYCFTSHDESHYVYVHHDGYPQGAYEKLLKDFPKTWSEE